jgi:CO dehydrogenase nickel-insertion accessory protein CooC1
MRSVETAKRILAMVPALGIRNARIVANKVRPASLPALRRQLSGEGLSADVGLAYSEELALRDLEGRSVFDYVDKDFERGVRAVLAARA